MTGFNLKDFAEDFSKLEAIVKGELPEGRSLYSECILWDDGDYRIAFTSNWGNVKDFFIFQHSVGKVMWMKIHEAKSEYREMVNELEFSQVKPVKEATEHMIS
jgi:hypothetical protein